MQFLGDGLDAASGLHMVKIFILDKTAPASASEKGTKGRGHFVELFQFLVRNAEATGGAVMGVDGIFNRSVHGGKRDG